MNDEDDLEGYLAHEDELADLADAANEDTDDDFDTSDLETES